MRLKIYVASSWRNTHQPGVVAALREVGHEVYDFRHPEPGDEGFRWSEIDPDWRSWTVDQYADALDHPAAERGFANDLRAVMWADLCVLVLPSGRSASFEYGFLCGMRRRPGVVYVAEPCEPELMYKGSLFVDSVPRLVETVAEYQRCHVCPIHDVIHDVCAVHDDVHAVEFSRYLAKGRLRRG